MPFLPLPIRAGDEVRLAIQASTCVALDQLIVTWSSVSQFDKRGLLFCGDVLVSLQLKEASTAAENDHFEMKKIQNSYTSHLWKWRERAFGVVIARAPESDSGTFNYGHNSLLALAREVS